MTNKIKVMHLRNPSYCEVDDIKYADGHFKLIFSEFTKYPRKVVLHLDRSWLSHIHAELVNVLKEEKKAVENIERNLTSMG